MNLSSPLRILWDLDLPEPVHLRILQDLEECRPFFLTLSFRGALHLDLLERACRLPGCRVTAVLRPEAALEATLPSGIRNLHLDLTSDPFPEVEALARLAERGPVLGLWMELWGHLVPRLGDLLDLARAAGVRRVALPNPRLVGGRGGEVLTAAHHGDLARTLVARGPWLGELDLAVHDFFAWRILSEVLGRPPTRGESPGCQAWDALAYVDPEGRLFGCSSLRGSVGDLRESRLMVLWNSPERRALRDRVEQAPAGCASCPDLPGCRSGCRGTVEFLHGHFGEVDPGCPFHDCPGGAR